MAGLNQTQKIEVMMLIIIALLITLCFALAGIAHAEKQIGQLKLKAAAQTQSCYKAEQ